MLTKKQFIQRLKFIMDYDRRSDEFDKALKSFATSDFTGFYDETLHCHLLDTLNEDMDIPSDDDIIFWWLYDCPEVGKNPQYCKVWDGNPEDPNTIEHSLTTPEELYDYIFTTYTKAPSKTTLKMAIKAQDNGVKFCLRVLNGTIENNNNAMNEGWHERGALLRFVLESIKESYYRARGSGADLTGPPEIMSVLDEDLDDIFKEES